MTKLYSINRLLTLTCLCGLGLSIYAYVIELQFQNDKNYKPLCDISEDISCSKVFRSQYAKGLGGLIEQTVGKGSTILRFLAERENSLYGILTYSLLATLSLSNSDFINKLLILAFLLSLLMSAYLAYILYVIKTICIVCVATYVVNGFGLALTLMKKTELNRMDHLDIIRKMQ